MARRLSSKARDTQRDALAIIDAVKSILEEMGQGGSLDDSFDLSNINIQLSLNPMDLLLKILTKFVSYEELVETLSKFLVYEVPVIELAIKAILLSNLKSTIDCTNDPRIPEKYRMKLNIPTYMEEKDIKEKAIEESDYTRGIAVSVGSIDYANMLSISPMSSFGRTKYFGTQIHYKVPIEDEDGDVKTFIQYIDAVKYAEENGIPINTIVRDSDIDTVYELARAKDFNAFLWFVIHKAKFPQSIPISVNEENPIDGIIDGFGGTILNELNGSETVNAVDGEIQSFSVGSTIVETSDLGTSTLMSLCFKVESEIDDKIGESLNELEVLTATKNYHYKFLPLSSDYRSANWYVNRKTYYDFLYKTYTKKGSDNPRDYSKEFAICNLRYEDVTDSSYEFMVNSQNKIRLEILPKPLLHLPKKIGSNMSVKRILFDSQGHATSKGKYTVKVTDRNPKSYEGKYTVGEKEHSFTNYYYEIYSKSEKKIYLVVDDNGDYYISTDYTNKSLKDAEANDVVIELGDAIPRDTGTIVDNYHKNAAIIPFVLYECYPGLTVYEFNYDFVMGMQLFDAKTLTAQLLEALSHVSMNGGVNFGLSFSKTESEYQMRIADIVKKMLEEDTSEVSDCFFTFSNEDYDSQLQESELKRANLFSFNDSENKAMNVNLDAVNNILNEYSDNATKEENKDVLKRAINQATASITEEVLPEDQYNVKFNFVVNMFKVFITILVETLLTPKVMLLLETNRRMIGDMSETLTFEDVLKALMGVITAIVRELRDMVLQYLLDWVIKILTELFEKIAQYVIMEQIMFYKEILLLLIKNCLPRFGGRKNLDTTLDKVDYADIDEAAQPLVSDC